MCNHHEAKYTATKLIFGHRFNDKELLEDGKQSLRDTLTLLRREGMAEYGRLPWFWHWTQAFTCALELMEEPELKRELHELLDELWSLRTSYYLKGAWLEPTPEDGRMMHRGMPMCFTIMSSSVILACRRRCRARSTPVFCSTKLRKLIVVSPGSKRTDRSAQGSDEIG